MQTRPAESSATPESTTIGLHAAESPPPEEDRSDLRTRLLSLAALGILSALAAGVLYHVYWAVKDSFVAPAILTADSEVVIAHKFKVDELEVERARALAEIEGIDVALAAARIATQRLEAVLQGISGGFRVASEITARRASAGDAELEALRDKRKVLTAMRDEQARLAEKTRTEMEAGVVSRSDSARDQQVLREIEVSLLENDRALAQANAAQHETGVTQRALAARTAGVTFEVAAREEQRIRIELETMRLASETRTKAAQRTALQLRVEKIDEVIRQLSARPFVKAAQQKLDVAFVPYTQLDGVRPGAAVYACVWGLLFCTRVGAVTDLIPGEVILPDPWGVPARGQYAVLQLTDSEAARQKVLRIRVAETGAVAAAAIRTDPQAQAGRP